MKWVVKPILVLLKSDVSLNESTACDAEGRCALDVAVRASWAYFRAAGNGVPRRVGPLNRAAVARPLRDFIIREDANSDSRSAVGASGFAQTRVARQHAQVLETGRRQWVSPYNSVSTPKA